MSKLKTQTKLPDKYTAERLSSAFGKDSVLFSRSQSVGGGMVTVDFELRMFCGGMVVVGSRNNKATAEYVGLGWRSRIIADAIEWLEDVMK